MHVITGDLPQELADEIRSGSSVAVDTETSGLDWRRDTHDEWKHNSFYHYNSEISDYTNQTNMYTASRRAR